MLLSVTCCPPGHGCRACKHYAETICASSKCMPNVELCPASPRRCCILGRRFHCDDSRGCLCVRRCPLNDIVLLRKRSLSPPMLYSVWNQANLSSPSSCSYAVYRKVLAVNDVFIFSWRVSWKLLKEQMLMHSTQLQVTPTVIIVTPCCQAVMPPLCRSVASGCCPDWTLCTTCKLYHHA